MIVQNNAAPWIFLALVIMVGCALAGMLLGNAGPLSTDIAVARLQITETKAAMDVRATQSALDSEQAEHAGIARKTALVESLTEIPFQQTATHIAEISTAQAAQALATHTALVEKAHNEQVLAQATRTAVANQMTAQDEARDATQVSIENQVLKERSQTILPLAVMGVGILLFVGWIIARAFTQETIARAQLMSSKAQLLAEQRRLESLRATIKAKSDVPEPSYPLPKSLLNKKTGDSDDLPRAE